MIRTHVETGPRIWLAPSVVLAPFYITQNNHGWHGSSFRLGNLLPDPLMRSCLVEVGYIGIEDSVELLLMQDEQMIEALTPHTAEETLTDCIRSRGAIRGFEYLDATCLRNPSEAHPKLAIVIPDEVLRTCAIGGGFPKLYVPSKHRWESV